MGAWVYRFGGGAADGNAGMRALLGGKGANLAEMAAIGLPVPPGFTITTALCNSYYDAGRTLPAGLDAEIEAGLAHIEGIAGAGFGDPDHTLLVSVRSGARASMPGMMDTVLNLGLNDETADGLARVSGDARFAYDSYRRLIQMYGDVVLGVEHRAFEELLEQEKEARGYRLDTEMQAGDWFRLIEAYKALVRDETGSDFPQDARAQLRGAIRAVLDSWMNARAVTYRRLHGISADWGTAVTVQAMVFGNMGEDCATGVAFTRNPSTGEAALYGEYLVNAQGEDVVAGIRTPRAVSEAGREASGTEGPSMEREMPEAFAALQTVMGRLERHYRDMQDVEFTVQRGTLWILQTRSGKRTAKAALKIAVDMAREGLVDEAEALTRVDPLALEQLLHPSLDPEAPRRVMARGLPASPGAACGKVVFDADEAEGPRQPRRGRDPAAHRDQPRGHPRHARRSGHRHQPGRHDQPRRRRGPRHGTPVYHRRRRASHRRGGTAVPGGRHGDRGGRCRHHRRRERRAAGGRGADDRARALRRFHDAHGLGGRCAALGRPHQRRDAGRCRDGAPLRCRRDRTLSHRTYVLRRRAHRRGARDDRGRRCGRPPPPRSQSCCRPSAPTSPRCSASWRGSR